MAQATYSSARWPKLGGMEWNDANGDLLEFSRGKKEKLEDGINAPVNAQAKLSRTISGSSLMRMPLIQLGCPQTDL